MTSLLGSLLGVGLVSLIIELLLRESYAKGLRHYLNLKTALVKSGLFDVASEPEFSAYASIGAGSTISAVIRDPQRWVQRNFEAVLNAAKQRSATVTLLWPDPDSEHFDSVAASLDYTPEALQANIRLALEWIQKGWAAAPVIETSTIKICGVPNPLYEVINVDKRVVCSLGRSFGHPQGEAQLAIAFEGQAYPVEWFKRQFDEGTPGGEVWASDGRQRAANARRP